MMNPHPHQRQSAISDLQVALRAIPQHEKVEWLHALRVAPHLVNTESDPMVFLRYCDWDVTAAARRLTVYWRKRVEVFGETRAFLQLLNEFSGNGALAREELQVLQSGVCCLMHNDVHNRSVFWNDRTNCPPAYRGRMDIRMRVAFYMFSQMALNPVSQTTGAVILIRGLQNNDNLPVARQTTELLREAFPLRICAIHIIYIRSSGDSYFQALAPFLLEHFGHWLNNKLFVHNCDSIEEVGEKLARHGLTRESLPLSMGGFTGVGTAALSSSLHSSSTIEQIGRAMITDTVNQQPQFSGWKPLPDSTTPTRNPLPVSNNGFQWMDASAGGTTPGTNALGLQQQLMLNHTTQQPPPQLHAHAPERLTDGGVAGSAALFGILDATILETEGSPFDPRPIRSEPAVQQQQSFVTNDNVVPTMHAVLHKETTASSGVAQGHSPRDPIRQVRSPPLEERRAATHSSPIASSTNDEARVHTGGNPVIETPKIVENGIAVLNEAMGVDSGGSPLDATPEIVEKGQSALNESMGVDSGGNPLVETPEIIEMGLAALKEAMDGLPDGLKSVYKEAVRGAPNLVQEESDPLKYLRFAKFDAWAAAQRLAKYWKYRVEYFGRSAFLPLTQTSGGALCDEDLETLNSGALFFLPADSRGRPILCLDLAKYPAGASKASRTRVAMYFFSILCREHPVATTEGFVVCVFVSIQITGLSKFDQTTREVTDIVLDSFPTKNCETHVIYSPPPASSPERSFMGLALPVLLRTIGRLLIQDRAHFHVGYTRDDLERRFGTLGLSGPCVEAALKGGISDHDFALWLQNRQTLELQRRDLAGQQPQPPVPPTGAQAVSGVAPDGNRKKDPLEPSRIASSAGAQDIDSGMEMVSASDKKVYMEACQKAPHLVKKESDPALFLKSENNDSVAAAKRLAAYWRIRYETFRERAFLPMDQTGDGALDRKDLGILQTSFLMQLPIDSEGCSVICCDGSRLEKSSSPASQLRIFFYLWHVVSQNEQSQAVGYNVLYTMTDPAFDRECRNCLDLVMEALPVRLKRFHLLGCCPDGSSESDFRRHGTVRDMMKLLDPSVREKVVIHVCESRSGFANKLVSYGIPRDGIPKPFGGSWGLEDFVLWQELRIRCEWELPVRATVLEAAERYSIPASIAPPPTSSLSREEKTERQRRMNVIHSRSKRERVRLEFLVLQEQCSALQEEQKELLRVGGELERLLQLAKVIVNEP